jgi:CheY-like chemotaxis protein
VVGLVPGQPTYRILVVDDKWNNRRLLVKLLGALGFELREATNGQEAIAVAAEWQPDLIWMDIRMPVLDGIEATRQIKATEAGKDIPIIALTASVFLEERTAVLEAGCDDFMRKPFREAEVFDALSRYLGVEFVYEGEYTQRSEHSTTATSKPIHTVLTSEALATLPTEWLAALHRAALQGDDDLALELIDQLDEQHRELARDLADIVYNFQLHQIVAATKPDDELEEQAEEVS